MKKNPRIRRIFWYDHDGYFSFQSKGYNKFLHWSYSRMYGFYTPITPTSQARILSLIAKHKAEFLPLESPFFPGMITDYQITGNL